MNLLPDDRRADLVPLFAPSQPAKTLLFAYLEGSVPGRAYVDDVECPRWCVVVVGFHHLAFVGGMVDDLDAVLAPVLDEVPFLDLVWDEGSGLRAPQRNVETRFARLEFLSLDRARWAATLVEAERTPGSLAPLDEAWFDRCDSNDEHRLAYGSAERFLETCTAFVLRDGNTYLSDASAIFSYTEAGTTWSDLQVVTAEAHRRRGYGLKVVSALMGTLLDRGVRPVWSCHKGNAASWGLAQSLGFHNPREFEIVCLGSSATG